MKHSPMVRRGAVITAGTVWLAAVAGTPLHATFAPPNVTTPPPTAGATISVSGSGGQLHLEFF